MEQGLAETLIENEIGCGPFQVTIVFFLFILVKLSSLFTFVFMSYGNYNPGWICRDNNNTNWRLNDSMHVDNIMSTDIPLNLNHTKDMMVYTKDETFCPVFKDCQNILFNPESVTIVTEWNLVCDRAWISSLLISVQMAGNLAGSSLAGHIADSIGRKKTLYFSIFVNALLTIGSIFSPMWEVFAVFIFLIGMGSAFFDSLNYVYPAEFLPIKWRSPLAGMPGWGLAGLLFGVLCMLLRNWKHILVARIVIYMVCLLPALWAPESLRWLEAKHKTKQFRKVADKMARCNRKSIRDTDQMLSVVNCGDREKNNIQIKLKTYSIIDLFRPSYRVTTIVVGLIWMCFTMIYYAIGFGVKAFNGDFYVNLIMVYAVMTPFAIFPTFTPNILGRKRSSIVFMCLAAICLISACIFEKFSGGDLKRIFTLVLAVVANASVDSTWCIQQVHTSELYPTVVRGLAINWASLMARIGGIAAPFLIPNDPSNVYIWYLILGCTSVVCCLLITRLRETKGQPLQQAFDD